MLALHLASGWQHPSLSSSCPDPDSIAAKQQQVKLLVTFAPPGSDFKAHPLPVISALAQRLGISHRCLQVQAPFLEAYQQQLKRLRQEHGITHLVTGDILDVASGFMEAAAQGTGVELVRPLWQCPRTHVLKALHDLNIRSRLSCIDLNKYRAIAAAEAGDSTMHNQQQQQQQQGQLSGPARSDAAMQSSTVLLQLPSQGFDAMQDLLGHELTPDLVAGPLTVAHRLCGADLCGEGGEYHTLVFEAPMLHSPLNLVPVEHRVVESGAYKHAYVVWQQLQQLEKEVVDL